MISDDRFRHTRIIHEFNSPTQYKNRPINFGLNFYVRVFLSLLVRSTIVFVMQVAGYIYQCGADRCCLAQIGRAARKGLPDRITAGRRFDSGNNSHATCSTKLAVRGLTFKDTPLRQAAIESALRPAVKQNLFGIVTPWFGAAIKDAYLITSIVNRQDQAVPQLRSY